MKKNIDERKAYLASRMRRKTRVFVQRELLIFIASIFGEKCQSI